MAESDTAEGEPRRDVPHISDGSSRCARDLKGGVDTEFITPTTNAARPIRARPLKDENGSSVELFKTSSVILSRTLPSRSRGDLDCVTNLKEGELPNCATPQCNSLMAWVWFEEIPGPTTRGPSSRNRKPTTSRSTWPC